MTTGWNSFFTLRTIAPILLFLPIAPIIKILLLYFTDVIDSRLYRYLVDPTYDGSTYEYHMYDKLMDTYTETMIALYLISFKVIPYQFYSYLISLLSIRLIGVLLFVNTNKTIYLKTCPDAFREFSIFVLITEFFPDNWRNFILKNVHLFAIIIFFIKMIFECFWHKVSSYPE